MITDHMRQWLYQRRSKATRDMRRAQKRVRQAQRWITMMQDGVVPQDLLNAYFSDYPDKASNKSKRRVT